MSLFTENAAGLLEAAESALRSGISPSNTTVLINEQGGIHIVCNSDWDLPTLHAQHGARTAYRLTQHAGKVRIEGRELGRTCVFESATPACAARLLLGSHACS